MPAEPATPASVMLFPGMVFRHVVSLGGNCEPAHQLRLNALHTVRGVFDWLVTPLDAIPTILADRGARLANEFVAVHEGTSVGCRAYDVLYHHEFPRDDRNRVIFGMREVERCRAKLRHKWDNLEAACRGNEAILFVRLGPESDLPWDRCGPGREPVRSNDLNRIADAIGAAFPGLEFRLLVIALPGGAEHVFSEALDPRVAVRALPRHRTVGWAADDEDWRALFSTLSLDRGGRARPDGETLYWFAGARVHELDPPPPSGLASPAGDAENAAAQAAAAHGQELWSSGRSHEALAAFRDAFSAGLRDTDFLRDYLDLLTGETRYGEVLEVGSQLADDEATRLHRRMLMGHARLALSHDRDDQVAAAERREASPLWLGPRAVLSLAAGALEEGRPFSFVRLGDGEARFLLATRPERYPVLPADEAKAMGEIVWQNWFGERVDLVDPADTAALTAALDAAIASADIVGATTARRLRDDTGHYGYLAAQEVWLREARPPSPDRFWTDALVPKALHAASPHLAALLDGLDVLGVISPHPELAASLAARFGIPHVMSHVIPAEGRLPTAGETRAAGRHFPERYRTLLRHITVPRRGALFLVAAGLLGKIYCARIKELGGVALDIGALGDAWMGFDTRQGQLAEVEPLPVVPPETGRTHACLSMAKTSSMALTAAMHDAKFADAHHLHYLGPRSIAYKQGQGTQEPMMAVAATLANRLKDPRHAFRVVTCFRDPIARFLAQAFHHVASHPDRGEIVRDHHAFVDWVERVFGGRDFSTEWIDDNLLATFGFDFRAHPFDRGRRSIRFESGRARILLLRQEDDAALKEQELGWLLDRDPVPIARVNDSAATDYVTAYRAFADSFVAPKAWLDGFYDTELIRHLYTDEERAGFRARWSGAGGDRPRWRRWLTAGSGRGRHPAAG